MVVIQNTKFYFESFTFDLKILCLMKNKILFFNIFLERVFIKQNINDKEFVILIEKTPKGLYIVVINNTFFKNIIFY